MTEMFTRLHRDVEGSGLGLATCRRIATAHGGTLRLEETPGGGTTAVFHLPTKADSDPRDGWDETQAPPLT